MLQQTQVARVIPKYEAWLKRFPTVEDVAKASVSEVLRFWSGLGYNRRALNLRKAAQLLLAEYSDGSRVRWSKDVSKKKKYRSTKASEGIYWPTTVDELVKLPGVGKYTASAVACFAFDQQIPVVDTNIRKVILVEFSPSSDPLPFQKRKITFSHSKKKIIWGGLTEKEIEAIAWQILPVGKAYEWNQALMDYSALMLKDKKIPLPKQSNFFSSNRYYRGKILKLLLEVHQISFSNLWAYFQEHNPIEQSRLEKVVEQMQEDGLITREHAVLQLPQ